jgi:hypothetical protein
MTYVSAESALYLSEMSVMWAAIAILGGTVALYSLLAWRRQHARPMLLLGAGLLLLSVVPAVMWLGVYMITSDLYATTLYCTGVMLTGFALVTASLMARVS